eukprot:Hpha_TRINITY_DN11182_c0_g1::TRINITY_DN11182_c0_g1_i1::g.27964::m.27964
MGVMPQQTGLRRARWMPDKAAKACPLCGAGFGFFRRRHHCRACGRVVCNGCSDQRVVMGVETGYEGPQRVCEDCFMERPTVRGEPPKADPVFLSKSIDGFGSIDGGTTPVTSVTGIQSSIPAVPQQPPSQPTQSPASWRDRYHSDLDRDIVAVNYTDNRTGNEISFFNVAESGAISYTVNGQQRPLVRAIKYSETHRGPRLDFTEIDKGSTLPNVEVLMQIRELATSSGVLHDIPASPVDSFTFPGSPSTGPVEGGAAAPAAPPPAEDSKRLSQGRGADRRVLEAAERESRSGIEADFLTKVGERHSAFNHALAVSSLRLRDQVAELNTHRRSRSQPPPPRHDPEPAYSYDPDPPYRPALETPEQRPEQRPTHLAAAPVSAPPREFWAMQRTPSEQRTPEHQPRQVEAQRHTEPPRQQLLSSPAPSAGERLSSPTPPARAPLRQTPLRRDPPPAAQPRAGGARGAARQSLQRSSTHHASTRTKPPAQVPPAVAPLGGPSTRARAPSGAKPGARGSMVGQNGRVGRAAPPVAERPPAQGRVQEKAFRRSNSAQPPSRLRAPSPPRPSGRVPTQKRSPSPIAPRPSRQRSVQADTRPPAQPEVWSSPVRSSSGQQERREIRSPLTQTS